MKHLISFILLCIALPVFSVNTPAIRWTEDMLHSMTLDEKIGQLFMIAAYSNRNSDYEESLEKLIKKYNIGGLIFFQGDPVRQAELTNRFQKVSKYPLMIGMDAEHGVGWRLQTAMEFPQMLIVGAQANDTLAYELGATIARHCKEIGVHVNFAPVVDINSNPLNPVIGMRSFGENPECVSNKAIMYMKGSLSEKVLPVAKHFPGHGDTDTDSHVTLPTITYTYRRLDSIELHPYKALIQAGIPAIMLGHLNVPALDSSGVPTSLSPVINRYLRENMEFDGICFTDALNMKGVTQGLEKGEAELKALLAGNDILLFPADIEEAIGKIKRAVADSLITKEFIDKACLKILMAKYEYVLPNILPIKTTALWSKINTPADFALKQKLYASALTLIKNEHNFIPLKRLDSLKIASVNFGAKEINSFQTMLEKYTKIDHFSINNATGEDELESLIRKLSAYNCIIIYNSTANNRSNNNFGFSLNLYKLMSKLKEKKIILCHPGIPYGLTPYMDLPINSVLLCYDKHLYAQQFAAQSIFGGVGINGMLPVGVDGLYPVRCGIKSPKTRLGYAPPEMCGIASNKLAGIDSLCELAIKVQATPGCQVLVAKNGYIIYNKAFGFNTYKKDIPNHTSNIYDLASVTKIAATLPAVMKLYDEGKLKLGAPLSDYYTALRTTNKKDITVEEVLHHSAGLKTFIPFMANAIDRKSVRGTLFSAVPTAHNRVKLQNKLYFNPDYQFKSASVSNTPQINYDSITRGLYIYRGYRDTIIQSILDSEISKKKEYAYSDLGFILLKYAVEEVSRMPLDIFCKNNFYQKLGATNTDFMGEQRLNKNYIVPSSIDKLYRKTEIKGFVHDPGAAILGGVAGHAGLFSTAEDLAKIMALYLNKGTYGDELFFTPETVNVFTNKNNNSLNRRGLGFDKPELCPGKPSPTCQAAPASSFGHTGFTGTIVWDDPANELIYIFLSNRTYPDEFNTRLSEENIRSRIQAVIYQALTK